MALQVTITNINSVTYPVDVYVCTDCPDTSCTLVDTIFSVPSTINIPAPYSGSSSFSVRIVDSANCEYCQTFGNTTTTTTTINPLCLSCDIGFDFYDTNPISEISVGEVTGSCDTNITDYVINWYGPGIGSSTVAFTSGIGNSYSGDYTYTHPLTGSSSVPVVAGVYTPIIQKIKLNGIEYTDLNCFQSTTVDVDALTCINGPGTNLPQYSHLLSFSAVTNLNPPPVNVTYALDPLKPYFAIRFDTELVYDSLKITLNAAAYTDPIILEYFTAGQSLGGSDLNLNTTPKKFQHSFSLPFVAKVLTLTGFTINTGDYIDIEVTPNPTNNNTNWKLYCECLENFDCSLCDDTNNTTPFKIIESSITQGAASPCDIISMTFQVSACTSSDFLRYMLNTGGTFSNINYIDNFYQGIVTQYFTNMSSTPQIQCVNGGYYLTPQCDTPSNSTITYSKNVPGAEGQITMTFTDFTDFQVYNNGWNNLLFSYSGNPTDCTDIEYYRYFWLTIPLASGNDNCGDTTGYETYFIHPSSTFTTGGTGPWTITIDMATITDCITFTSCDLNCNTEVLTTLSNVNNSSTGTTNNISITSNTGSRLVTPWHSVTLIDSGSTTFSSSTVTNQMWIPKYINETVPYSGNPLTIIPNLSGKTCDFNNWTYNSANPSINNGFYVQFGFWYEVRRTNPLNVADFEIWTTNLTNGTYTGYPGQPTALFKIYEFVGGVPNVIDPNFFV
jgi:hypothetical protein